jgi:hypothetical protein
MNGERMNMKIARVEKHKNIEGYVLLTFEDGTEKIMPTTEEIMNKTFKEKLFQNGGDLIFLDDIMSGRHELFNRFGIMDFGDKKYVQKNRL